MMACLDVAYSLAGTVAACVTFEAWSDGTPTNELVWYGPPAAPYRRGRLFERELPPLVAVLEALQPPPSLVIVDAYVWLDEGKTPGLGGHLFRALGGATVVMGVAKRPFAGAPAIPVRRGRSRRPLWVSAAGVEPGWAAERIAAMHGSFRLPTLVQRADWLAREGLVRR